MQRFLNSRYASYSLTALGIVLALLAVMVLPNWSGFAAEAREEAGPFWASDLSDRGERLYAQNCATCHGWNGEGMEDIFPPLAGSRVVNGVESWTLMLVLHGRGAMPGFGHFLDDDEIAVVSTYVRENWGNQGRPVSPAMVRRVRMEGFEY
jgi:cytochrome c oxidase subunit II